MDDKVKKETRLLQRNRASLRIIWKRYPH